MSALSERHRIKVVCLNNVAIVIVPQQRMLVSCTYLINNFEIFILETPHGVQTTNRFRKQQTERIPVGIRPSQSGDTRHRKGYRYDSGAQRTEEERSGQAHGQIGEGEGGDRLGRGGPEGVGGIAEETRRRQRAVEEILEIGRAQDQRSRSETEESTDGGGQ